MKNIQIIVSVLFAAGLLTISTQNVMASTNTNENGFNQGYNAGLAQGGIDRQAHVFHIGTICIGHTLAWCDGYTDGYLDGFFSVLPTVTHSSTTTRIIVHDNHHNDHHSGDKGCHDNMTSCDVKKIPKTTVVTPTTTTPDKPTTPTTIPDKPTTTPDKPSVSSGGSSNDNIGSSNDNSGSSSSSSTQPTISN